MANIPVPLNDQQCNSLTDLAEILGEFRGVSEADNIPESVSDTLDQAREIGLQIDPKSDLDALIFTALLSDEFADLFDGGSDETSHYCAAFARLLGFLEERSGTTIDELGLSWFA